MSKAIALSDSTKYERNAPAIGVFVAGDPRIDAESRQRCVNICKMVADTLAARVKLPDGSPAKVVWAPTLVDGEAQADLVAKQFQDAGVKVLVCAPDTWAFPQLSVISLLQQFPADTPINFTCGNSGPKPGVVFAHAVNGAIAQYGRLTHLNVGTWPDTGLNPVMTEGTADALVDWAAAAITTQALKGRRVVVFGHDSMGMETALAHIIPTRKQFGIEITRLDMKLLADMLNKKAYKAEELKALRAFVDGHLGKRIELRDAVDSERFDQSLALYLIARDLLKDLDAVGGGFMSQLEWGSDRRGIPLPVADAMESFFNSSFDHNGPKMPLPFATEADVQALLTMIFFSSLTGGNPPLFMDFRKVWEPWELQALAEEAQLHPAGRRGVGREGAGGRRQLRQRLVRLGRQTRRQRGRDHGQDQHAAGRPGLLPRHGQLGALRLAGRAGRHRRPPDVQQPLRHVQPELGRGGHRRGARADGHRPLPDHNRRVAAHLRRAEVRHDVRVQALPAGQPLPHDPGPEPGAAGVLDGPEQRPLRLRLGGAAEVHRRRRSADPAALPGERRGDEREVDAGEEVDE